MWVMESHGKLCLLKSTKEIKFLREENSTNIPKMKDDFQENGKIQVMENLEKSWKRSWKVMEFQKLKRVRTLSIAKWMLTTFLSD